jgi:hypothetical protein
VFAVDAVAVAVLRKAVLCKAQLIFMQGSGVVCCSRLSYQL